MVRQHISDTAAGLDTSYSSHALTMAHCDFVYFQSLQDLISRTETQGQDFVDVLRKMSNVFALSILYQPHHPTLAFALSSSLPPSSSTDAISALRSAYATSLTDFSESAAQLVSAWGLTAYELDSALARSDKTPYEALWEGAKGSEMNEMGQDVKGVIRGARGVWKDLKEEKEGRAKL